MDIASLIVVFICVWWLALFTVLPLWVEPDEGRPHEASPGAPKMPHLKRKFLLATVIAVCVTGGAYWAVSANVLDFKQMARDMAEEDYGEGL